MTPSPAASVGKHVGRCTVTGATLARARQEPESSHSSGLRLFGYQMKLGEEAQQQLRGVRKKEADKEGGLQ